MRIPRPPAPIYAASVADAMISEAAMRTPEKASGKAVSYTHLDVYKRQESMRAV